MKEFAKLFTFKDSLFNNVVSFKFSAFYWSVGDYGFWYFSQYTDRRFIRTRTITGDQEEVDENEWNAYFDQFELSQFINTRTKSKKKVRL